MKISEWLSKFHGHSALDVELVKASFENETGEPWPVGLVGRPVAELLKEGRSDYKGLQVWNGRPNSFVIGAWQVARLLAKKYARKYTSHMLGRGSEFAECVDALVKKGR